MTSEPLTEDEKLIKRIMFENTSHIFTDREKQKIGHALQDNLKLKECIEGLNKTGLVLLDDVVKLKAENEELKKDEVVTAVIGRDEIIESLNRKYGYCLEERRSLKQRYEKDVVEVAKRLQEKKDYCKLLEDQIINLKQDRSQYLVDCSVWKEKHDQLEKAVRELDLNVIINAVSIYRVQVKKWFQPNVEKTITELLELQQFLEGKK
jgi:hypothetical protein